jgi:hypothetical protein
MSVRNHSGRPTLEQDRVQTHNRQNPTDFRTFYDFARPEELYKADFLSPQESNSSGIKTAQNGNLAGRERIGDNADREIANRG